MFKLCVSKNLNLITIFNYLSFEPKNYSVVLTSTFKTPPDRNFTAIARSQIVLIIHS